MWILASSGKLTLVLYLFEAMGKMGVKRDTFTFNALILAFCNSNCLREAEILMEKMRTVRKKRMELNRERESSKFGEIGPKFEKIREYERMNLRDFGKDFCEGIPCCNFLRKGQIYVPETDSVSYVTLLGHYAEKGDWKKAESLFKKMEEDEFEVSKLPRVKVRNLL